MSLVDLANLGEFVGALGVVASLIFVGFEIRRNTRATRATTMQMNADYWLHYMTSMANRENGDVYAKGAAGRENLDPQEFGQFFFLCRSTFMGCENQHHQYLAGLLDDDAYRGYEATIREQIAAFPGIRAMWQLVKHTYGSDFVEFFDNQIASIDAHGRGSMHKQWQAILEADGRMQKPAGPAG